MQQSFAQKVTVINQKGTKIDVNNNRVTTATEENKPTNPLEGDIWFDETDSNNVVINVFDGENWLNNYNINNNETTTLVSNTIPGHKIADYTNENNEVVDIKETITSFSQNTSVTSNSTTSTGELTYTDENGNESTAQVVSTDANNTISVGSDGGAYMNFYEKIVIWAEQSDTLGAVNNGEEWSFGNGAHGKTGIPLPEAWELYAVSFNADVSSSTECMVRILVVNTANNGDLVTFDAVGTMNNMIYTEVLTNPVTVPAGACIGFNTVVVSRGTVSNARVAVFLRRKP